MELNVTADETPLAAFLKLFDDVIIPACKAYKDYGLCRAEQKGNFLHGLHLFHRSLIVTDKTLGSMVRFDVDEELYAEHLCTADKIYSSSINMVVMRSVGLIMRRWMRRMDVVINQGIQLKCDSFDVGPIDELEYWQEQLIRYTSITEFVSSEVFLNHLAALEQSRSSLVRVSERDVSNIDRFMGQIINRTVQRNGWPSTDDCHTHSTWPRTTFATLDHSLSTGIRFIAAVPSEWPTICPA